MLRPAVPPAARGSFCLLFPLPQLWLWQPAPRPGGEVAVKEGQHLGHGPWGLGAAGLGLFLGLRAPWGFISTGGQWELSAELARPHRGAAAWCLLRVPGTGAAPRRAQMGSSA